jgi:MoaA/NifB/PqqE/SkfB family radical SAM enzyme
VKESSRLYRMANLLCGRAILPYDKLIFSRRSATPRRALNFLRAKAEGRLRVRRPKSYPMALQLEPTTLCRLDCPHCPRIKATAGMTLGHMELDNYERLMREIGPSLVGIAFWQWGEPLLHPRMVDMVRLANSYGIVSFMSTNAQLDPNEVDLPGLVESGLDMLIVSMDGATQDVYQSFRAGGSLERLKDFTQAVIAQKKASGRGPLVNIRVVATRSNESDIEDVRRFALESGADVFSVKSISLYYDSDPANPHLPEDKRYRSFQYKGTEEAEDYRRKPNYCRKPWLWPTLRYDGTLLTCECDHQMTAPLGNVFTAGSFREIWHGDEARKVRERFGGDGAIDLEFCRRCRYKMDDAIRRVERFT